MNRALFALAALTLGCSENTLHGVSGAGMGDGPAIEVAPSSLDFGILSEADEPVVRTFVIRSIGNMDLDVEEIEITGQASGSFTVLSGGETPFVLPVGAEHEVEVVFVPLGANQQSAQAIISSSAENTPKVPVSLLGEGAIPELQISPDPLDFGRTYVGCDKDNSVTLTNVGTDELTISDITLDGEEFALDAAGVALPHTLQPSESFSLPMSFAPQLEGEADGILSVTSTEPMGTRTAIQVGEGIYAATYEDNWENPTNSPSDIIFAVDQSCSMDDNTAQLANNFSTFITQLSNYSADWQIIVANDDNGCNSTGILTPSTPNYVSTFSNRISSGGGSYTEALLTVANTAVDKTDSGECNASFMRSNAMLHIVLVSDEPEQSYQSWSTLVNSIIAKKGSAAAVRISSIVGDVPGGCRTADAGTGYVEATNYTGGVFLSICSDWASTANLALLAEASVIQDTYELSNTAIGATVEVYVNGTKSSSSNWYFDEESNSVVFTNSAPEEGDTIRITYAAPASCD